jgi:hypothetical protein
MAGEIGIGTRQTLRKPEIAEKGPLSHPLNNLGADPGNEPLHALGAQGRKHERRAGLFGR